MNEENNNLFIPPHTDTWDTFQRLLDEYNDIFTKDSQEDSLLKDYIWEQNKVNSIELTPIQKDYLIRVKTKLNKSLDFPLQLTQLQFIDRILENNSYKEEDRPRLNKLKELVVSNHSGEYGQRH